MLSYKSSACYCSFTSNSSCTVAPGFGPSAKMTTVGRSKRRGYLTMLGRGRGKYEYLWRCTRRRVILDCHPVAAKTVPSIARRLGHVMHGEGHGADRVH